MLIFNLTLLRQLMKEGTLLCNLIILEARKRVHEQYF